jgi:hydroxyacylglutathione hydrolase
MENNPHNNNRAILIGIVLIGLVGLATVSRFISSRKNDSAQNTPESSSSKEKAETNSIATEDLLKKISSGESLITLDMRDSESFQNKHILNSKNISPKNADSFFSTQDKNKTFVLVDDGDSNYAELLADSLIKEGFKNTLFLKGGFPEWESSFGPVVSAGDPESFSDQAKVSYISSDDLIKEIDGQDPSLYIIDVRKSGSFSDGHIKNANNIYLETLEQNRKQIPLGKKIVVYDNDGLWAFMAAVRLFDMGIGNVQALSDGFDAWKEKGYEVVK